MTDRTIRPSYLVDQVITALKQDIERSVLEPTDRLPSEAKLSAQFQVGRSTVREALRVLAHMGVIETRSGRGSFVARRQTALQPLGSSMSLARVEDIYRFRFAIEQEGAPRAAANRDDAQLGLIQKQLEGMKAAHDRGDLDAAIACDTNFHIAILDAGKCDYAAAIYRLKIGEFNAALRRFIEASGPLPPEGSTHSPKRLHDQLVAAIASKDVRRASAILKRDRKEMELRLRLLQTQDGRPAQQTADAINVTPG